MISIIPPSRHSILSGKSFGYSSKTALIQNAHRTAWDECEVLQSL